MANPSHIFITGAPGSGKSHESKRLSKETGLPVVELDKIPNTGDERYVNTEVARNYIAKLKKPHIVEGSQLLGLNEDELKDHRVILMDTSPDTLFDRLKHRGYADTRGKHHKGLKGKEAYNEVIAQFGPIVKEFKEKAPHMEIKTALLRAIEIRANEKLAWMAKSAGAVKELAIEMEEKSADATAAVAKVLSVLDDIVPAIMRQQHMQEMQEERKVEDPFGPTKEAAIKLNLAQLRRERS